MPFFEPPEAEVYSNEHCDQQAPPAPRGWFQPTRLGVLLLLIALGWQFSPTTARHPVFFKSFLSGGLGEFDEVESLERRTPHWSVTLGFPATYDLRIYPHKL